MTSSTQQYSLGTEGKASPIALRCAALGEECKTVLLGQVARTQTGGTIRTLSMLLLALSCHMI